MHTLTIEDQIKLLKQRVKERSAQISLMEAAPELWSKDFLQANRLEQAFDKRLIGSLYKHLKTKKVFVKWYVSKSAGIQSRLAKDAYRRTMNSDMEGSLF